jgi:pilus assembly protein CpaF
VVEVADLFVSRDDRLVRAQGWPPHPERFTRAGIDLADVLGETGRPRLEAAAL